MLSFLYVTVASIAVGAAFGLGAGLLIKKLKGVNEHSDREAGLIILLGYVSYMVAEMVGLSGIMAVFCCGAIMTKYTYYNLSRGSQHGTKLVFIVISQGAEAFTFTYLGMSVLNIPIGEYDWLLLSFMFSAMIVGRAVSVFFSSAVGYFIQCRRFGLSLKDVYVLFFSGLIRGAIAFALVLHIESHNVHVMISTTMGIAIFTTVVLSALLGPFTNFIGLETTSEEIYGDIMSSEVEHTTNNEEIAWFPRMLRKFDEKYLVPYFGGEEKKEHKKNWEKLWEEENI